MNDVYVKNLKRAVVSEMEFKKRVRIVNRTNKKGLNLGNIVMEMSKQMRDILVPEGKM